MPKLQRNCEDMIFVNRKSETTSKQLIWFQYFLHTPVSAQLIWKIKRTINLKNKTLKDDGAIDK